MHLLLEPLLAGCQTSWWYKRENCSTLIWDGQAGLWGSCAERLAVSLLTLRGHDSREHKRGASHLLLHYLNAAPHLLAEHLATWCSRQWRLARTCRSGEYLHDSQTCSKENRTGIVPAKQTINRACCAVQVEPHPPPTSPARGTAAESTESRTCTWPHSANPPAAGCTSSVPA